jgi:pimeloyl-ACP methyl ester carboxylesterase
MIVPPSTDPTFENQQNLILTSNIRSPETPLLDQSVLTLPTGMPISISYSLTHAPNWPYEATSNTARETLFSNILHENSLYLELWKGIPFTTTARLVENWNISSTSSGQVSATIPEEGNYFLTAYFPDGYYIDPQTTCINDPDWQTDCAPSYTLDQVREYFSTPFTSLADPPSIPTAFGGLQFSIKKLVTTPKVSNILFLPGIEGSRLYMRNAFGLEQTIWEPSVFSSVANLALRSDGSSEHEVYTRDLVNYVFGIKAFGDVYGPFEDYMDSLVENGTISKWQAYPYDWRHDVRDVVANGTLVGSSSGTLQKIYLQDVVQSLASSSPTGKVTIISHSNGGLLAKALAIELEKENKVGLIDRIIFIGSPQYGTPLTIGSLLNGDGQTDPTGGIIMYGGTVRTAAANLPGMYGLLPSAAYFAHTAAVPILFAASEVGNLYEKYFGSEIHSASSLTSFLIDTPNISATSPRNDLRTPLVLSSNILQKESDTHAALDAWTPPASLKITAIAGWGNLTPYQYIYTSSNKKYLSCFRTDAFTAGCAYANRISHTVKSTESGDNTVVSLSAFAGDSDAYYFDAKSFKEAKLGTIGHGNLTSAMPILSLVQKIITQSDTSSISYISTSTPENELSPLTVVSVHSPMNIVATDASGNQTGIFSIPEHPQMYYKKEDIDGSSLQILDDEKYLYLPEDETFTISFQGYDFGESEIDIGTMGIDGITTTKESFIDIPTTASTTAEFTLVASSTDATSTFPTEIKVTIFADSATTTIMASTQENEKSLDVIPILEKSFRNLQVRRGVKNRFISELKKVQSLGVSDQAKYAISYLGRLITAQVEINLTDEEGAFFLKLLTSLQGNSAGLFN